MRESRRKEGKKGGEWRKISSSIKTVKKKRRRKNNILIDWCHMKKIKSENKGWKCSDLMVVMIIAEL